MSDPKQTHTPAPEETRAESAPGRNGISRRGFLKGAGFTAAGTALLDGVQAFSSEASATTHPGVTQMGPDPVSVRLSINGKEHALQIEPRTTLADALRIHLGMTGTKIICDHGACSGLSFHALRGYSFGAAVSFPNNGVRTELNEPPRTVGSILSL